MRDFLESVKLKAAIALAYTRETLSKLEEQPWFPRRKVIAAGIAGLATNFLTTKLGLSLGVVGEAMVVGFAAGFVGWLIPERPRS